MPHQPSWKAAITFRVAQPHQVGAIVVDDRHPLPASIQIEGVVLAILSSLEQSGSIPEAGFGLAPSEKLLSGLNASYRSAALEH